MTASQIGFGGRKRVWRRARQRREILEAGDEGGGVCPLQPASVTWATTSRTRAGGRPTAASSDGGVRHRGSEKARDVEV